MLFDNPTQEGLPSNKSSKRLMRLILQLVPRFTSSSVDFRGNWALGNLGDLV
jgi:hypothetical protein